MTTGGTDPRIAGRRRAAIRRMAQGPESGLATGIAEVGGPIRGPVIDDDDLEVGKALGTDAVQGLTDAVRAVVGRDDDRNRGGQADGQDGRLSQW